MKRLLLLLLIAVLLTACTPDIPEIEPIPINCNGHYQVHYIDWKTCGCPSCPTYDKGTYWINYNDGRMFLLGEPVINPIEMFGKCPTEYIKEIFI